ncbi:MAG: LysM peptidoglycan-binding domain-containing protein [Desulfatiglandales bacterium]|jgi:uncharacterized coiled-coil protein SlyX
MNEDLDKTMKGFPGETADDQGYLRKNENIQRRRVFLDFRPKRNILILGGVGILLLIVLIAIFSGGGKKLPTEDLSVILVRVDLLEKRLTRLEGVEVRIDLLEKQEEELRQFIIEMDRSGTHLKQRLDKLTETFDRLQKRMAAGAAKTEASRPVQRKPVSLAVGRYHEVRSGENLYRIAQRYGISVKELCRLNNITPDQAIHPGQKLLVAPGSHE